MIPAPLFPFAWATSAEMCRTPQAFWSSVAAGGVAAIV